MLFIVLSGMALLTFHFQRMRDWLTGGPRRPKKQIETTYEIGWWAYKQGLHIDQFKVDVLDSRLNLFNNKSLVSYTITGTLTAAKTWKPDVYKIHLSERYSNFGTDSAQAVIEITPVITVKENNKYNGEVIPFHVTNELIIESSGWGTNKLLFKCADREVTIELIQRK